MNLSPKIVVCMTSHNRIDCARISQEIIKLNYADPLPIVHASSSNNYDSYLEDAFESCIPKSLHAGAINLLQVAIRLARDRFPGASYIVHIESDTWLMDQAVVYDYVAKMEATGALLATCAWSYPGRAARAKRLTDKALYFLRLPPLKSIPLPPMTDFSTQFFVMRMDSALVDAVLAIEPNSQTLAEDAFFQAFTRHFSLDRVIRMIEREPLSHNRYWCEAQSLYCQHWPTRGSAADPREWWDSAYVRPSFPGKRESLLKYPHIRSGEHLGRLLSAEDLSYYNRGAMRY